MSSPQPPAPDESPDATAILGGLAECDPVIGPPFVPDGHLWCVLCTKWVRGRGLGSHHPRCPWRLAVERQRSPGAVSSTRYEQETQ